MITRGFFVCSRLATWLNSGFGQNCARRDRVVSWLDLLGDYRGGLEDMPCVVKRHDQHRIHGVNAKEATASARPLVVEDDIQEGAVNLQTAVIIDEAQLPKLVHEETHP